MTKHKTILDFYTRPSVMTAADRNVAMFDNVPRDAAAVCEIVQGLLVHEHLATHLYGVEISDERRAETHIRSTCRMLGRLAHRTGPLDAALPVGERLVCTCRNFTVLFVAMLRSRGTPARARCGFGAYFTPGLFEDHWVGEYWNMAQSSWVRVDAQLDATQRELLKIDFDVLDVPHDQFVIAGDAWAEGRAGKTDPAKFGFSFLNEFGFSFIAGNLIRDTAALNNMELLPWDVWGAMPGLGEQLNDDQFAFFDRLTALTRAPDASFAELRALYEHDDRLRVPSTVFNAVLNRQETI